MAIKQIMTGEEIDALCNHKIDEEKLREILAGHREWLDSKGKTGQQADLQEANLEEANLHEVRLRLAKLQGADLQRANLQGADLQGANLEEANLQEANLQGINLQGADLRDANLQGANLHRADLQRANLQGANLRLAKLQGAKIQVADFRGANLHSTDLREADLQGANLREANLQEANLQDAKLQEAKIQAANLQRADLRGASLWRADLREANFQRAILVGARLQNAKFQRTNLMAADLRGANLRGASFNEVQLLRANLHEADLQDIELGNAKGLIGGQLSGANVSGVKLPSDVRKFEGLTTVKQASKSARKLLIVILLACAYFGLTLFSAEDAALLTNSTTSPLPLIQTSIPTAGFFVVAPILLVAIYFYFHLHLYMLWDALGSLPAIFPDGRTLEKRAYPWLLTGLVRHHFKLLKKDRLPVSFLQWGISVLLAWWIVPITIGLFWLRYLPRHDWVGTGFHMAFLVITIFCAVWFQRLAVRTLRGEERASVRLNGKWWQMKLYKGTVKRNYKLLTSMAVVFALVFFVSNGAINGKPGGWIPHVLPHIGAGAFTDLDEADVSSKPPGWTGLKEKEKEEIALVRGAHLQHRNFRYANARQAFLVNADLRFADLQGAKLMRANLQGADLAGANLQEADLAGANLQGAELYSANLAGAQLKDADLRGVFLSSANLQGAELYSANLHGAQLMDADLRGAFLSSANLRGVSLSNADLQGVTLWRADLQEADLAGAELLGADFRRANFEAADVKEAMNWRLAFYSQDMLKKLGLPPDHNEKLEKNLAQLKAEKEKAKREQ